MAPPPLPDSVYAVDAVSAEKDDDGDENAPPKPIKRTKAGKGKKAVDLGLG
ncbi:hypothetical protein LTR56_001333 [Elasticomyces elasticus]|nr:hypothetical protein LTR56_001333 [Elasticomyces elasticus]KAK3667514.1 hypothetical protein LTR22_001692 [Elasticomyces elasticus]KAK4928006.1 hypothetical protein LTR49_005205 [Elasticomyces elasticus]